MRFVVISAKKRSARFIQDVLVGVKCSLKRGCFSSQACTSGVLLLDLTPREAAGAQVHRYPLAFGKVAKITPPVPYDPHYDAKAWEVCLARHRPGQVVFWNVAPIQRSYGSLACHALCRHIASETVETAMHIESFAENGVFAPGRIAAVLRTTKEEVARTVGLGRDALMRADRVQSPKTQKRLREMVEILNRVEPRFGSALIAYAWYRSEPLAGFGGLTAMQLVRDGRAAEVMDYVDAVDAGVHV